MSVRVSVSEVLARLDSEEEGALAFLAELCALPSLTGEEEGDADARGAAAALLLRRLEEIGLAGRLVDVEGAPPYVSAEWLGRAEAPTLLIYGHYDVVPAGRTASWLSSPWELTRRDGRLYARGAADDKGGCALALAVLAAWFEAKGAPPLNIRVLFEGEEESGSTHFAELINLHPDLLACDVALIMDGGSFETGRPTMDESARGGCLIEVECRAIEAPVHAGLWGGAIPDVAMTLCSLLGRLVDDRGRIAVPGLYDRVAERSPEERERLRAIDCAGFIEKAGLVEGASTWGEEGYSTAERLWTRPAFVTYVLEGRDVEHRTAAYMERALARVGLRTVPDMDEVEAGEAVVRHLESMAPRGTKVSATLLKHAPWWRLDRDHPAVRAALRSLGVGFGCEARLVGSGGSIGMLGPLVSRFPGLPCLILGLEDPSCGAHAENESLSLDEWRKMGVSIALLMAELAALERP
jgi:acetylornithine deacetylase/succinyl-diaminopimelate desuccinylase-like protein